MKFRQTRDYSEPISKINPKWQMSINAMILRQTLKQTPTFGGILISSEWLLKLILMFNNKYYI